MCRANRTIWRNYARRIRWVRSHRGNRAERHFKLTWYRESAERAIYSEKPNFWQRMIEALQVAPKVPKEKRPIRLFKGAKPVRAVEGLLGHFRALRNG
jgi:hypothetical protein